MSPLGWPSTILLSTSVKYASGSSSLSLQVSINEAIVAQCSAPPRNQRTKHFSDTARSDGLSARRVVVELDTAIVDEARRALPARQRVSDSLGEFALLTDEAEFGAQTVPLEKDIRGRGADERRNVSPPESRPLVDAFG